MVLFHETKTILHPHCPHYPRVITNSLRHWTWPLSFSEIFHCKMVDLSIAMLVLQGFSSEKWWCSMKNDDCPWKNRIFPWKMVGCSIEKCQRLSEGRSSPRIWDDHIPGISDEKCWVVPFKTVIFPVNMAIFPDQMVIFPLKMMIFRLFHSKWWFSHEEWRFSHEKWWFSYEKWWFSRG